MAAAALIAVALAACDGSRPAPVDSVAAGNSAPAVAAARDSAPAAAPAPATSESAGTAASGACLSEGQWRECSVEKRLTDAGFVPLRTGAAPAGVFALPGTHYTLGAADLHVYLFASAADRERALAGLDTVAVARRGGAAPWGGAPTLITSNNLAAVLVSDNGRLIERVQLAITAGLPSAAR